MTASLRLDPWTLRPRAGAAAGLPQLTLDRLPPRMIEPPVAEPRGSRRTRIWELSSHLHCSIVGTCLSTGELRHVVGKAQLSESGSEHDLHGQGVLLASLRDGRAKLLHKALDRRHRAAIGRFDAAGTVEEVRALWRQAVGQGEIPGGYWAALTHPATTDALVREVFGEAHMLSHLVGAANRADIRRLSELEAENARLREKLARQQECLREAITSRDERIRGLSDLVAHRIAEQPDDKPTDPESTGTESTGAESTDAKSSDEGAALTALVASLERRLRGETSRRATLEERLAIANEALQRERRQCETLGRREQALGEELQALEAELLASSSSPDSLAPSLDGMSLLYVGGRTDRVGHLRAATERLGASFLHHDGGVDERSGLLGGLVSRADLVLFPVDCVSHEAVSAIKRLCRHMQKPFVPLRSTGMGSFAAALSSLPHSSPLPR